MTTVMQQRVPPAKYRINRRAASVLSGVFLLIGGGVSVLFFFQSQPERQLQYYRESAREYFESQQWRQAAIQFENIIRLEPDDVEALYGLGTARLEILRDPASPSTDGATSLTAAQLRTAIACYRRVTQIDPGHLPAQRWLLELDLRRGNWEEARQRLAVVSARSPADPLIPLAWELLPTAHPKVVEHAKQLLGDEAGREAEVVALLEPLCDECPGDLDALGPLLVALTRLEQIERRDGLLNRARSIVGDSSRLAYHRAQCALFENDRELAARLAQIACQDSRVEIPARRLLAEFHARDAAADPATASVRYHQAIAEYRRILALEPDDQQAANNAAWILGHELRRTEEALAMTKGMLARSERPLPELLDTHGWLLLQQGKYDDAIDYLERATEAAPADASFQLHLAIACAKSGRLSEGFALLGGLLSRGDVDLSELQLLLAKSERIITNGENR